MRRAPELWLALAIIAALAVGYALAPARLVGSDTALGESLGALGLALMLATEILYTVRKRARDRAWGAMSRWLRAHIVTGLVGPFLVALHGGGHLHGPGGWAAIAVAIVVASGVTGRYLYTAIPRTATGLELSRDEIDAALSAAELRLSSTDLGARERRELAAESLRLRRRASGADTMRRWLAGWHTFHVPLTLAMFTLAGIHVAIALYYSAGMR